MRRAGCPNQNKTKKTPHPPHEPPSATTPRPSNNEAAAQRAPSRPRAAGRHHPRTPRPRALPPLTATPTSIRGRTPRPDDTATAAAHAPCHAAEERPLGDGQHVWPQPPHDRLGVDGDGEGDGVAGRRPPRSTQAPGSGRAPRRQRH
eukprot:TRINITY_DN7461_c0_g1_i1.p2 TRINITY_DN7461_c0_g1~~TRINITY_DN7461_c0_g1_i1.p2  ORF type:complete len:147 (-),score=5.11 TRINITY_DN7461_c0_g1_i1:29-469(-)